MSKKKKETKAYDLPLYKTTIDFGKVMLKTVNNLPKDLNMTIGHELLNDLFSLQNDIRTAYKEFETADKLKITVVIVDKVEKIELGLKTLMLLNAISSKKHAEIMLPLADMLKQSISWRNALANK